MPPFPILALRFFFAANIPFSKVDHPQFRRLIEMLRPGVKVLGRSTLSGRLLDEEYSTVLADARSQMQGQLATLSIDGWSNVSNGGVSPVTPL